MDTGDSTQTGGRLGRVAIHIRDELFCSTYGDGVSDVDIGALINQHRADGLQATLTAVQPPVRYGALHLDQTLVRNFQEKPDSECAMPLTSFALDDENILRPLVSVVLPVFNGERYLQEAIDSILGQSFRNFELIIINDGSTDDSGSIIEQYDDPRVRYYTQSNIGLAGTLNRGIDIARGSYVARQDQDDVSNGTRLEKQVQFLDDHPEFSMVGTCAEIWVEGQSTRVSFSHPCDDESLRFKLLFTNPFVHSSMMIRAEVFSEVGTYCTDQSRQPPEDYELWSRVARRFKVANLPEVLHVYRETGNSMSRSGTNPFLEKVVKISTENLLHVLGGGSSSHDVMNLTAIYNGAFKMIKPPVRPITLGMLTLRAIIKVSDEKILSLLRRDRMRSLAKFYWRYFSYVSFCIRGRGE